jgi:serine/threonine-protein kinase
VFALGAILYEMLCGKPAFAGETLATVVVKVMLEAPPPIEELQPAVPAAVRGAVMRALEKDPQKRFPDVASFIGELTGSPLQTLDRRPAVTPEVNPGFLPTEAPGTPVPPTNPPDPFGSTAAGVPTPAPATPSLAGSLARGEVAIPTEPVVQKKRGLPMLWIALAGVVVLGGGAFVLLRAPSPPPQENQKNDEVEARLRELEQKLKEQKKAPEPSKPPEIMVAANDVPVVAAKPVAANAAAPPPPPTRPVAAAPKHETLPPEVAAELADAEAKLGGGDPREALRLARHSLLAQKSGRAFSVIARALCKQGDLGGARAALHSVDKNDLARVKRECKAAGIDL